MSLEPGRRPLNEAFRIGDRLVTPSSNEINGVRVDSKSMEVLVALAETAPEVVSAATLLETIWPRVLVVDNVVYQAIAQLRKALGDDARAPLYIETVPRRGYRIVAPIASAPSADRRSPAMSREPLLAVLAFDNLSGDTAMSYFSDGVSEEIQQTIARGSALKVIGRASSFQFRGADKAASKIARELKATHILDGSVRRSGDRVRITTQLIDCANESILWSDRFDHELSDIFALQDEIGTAVAGALNVAFASSSPVLPIDPEAYVSYLHARKFGLGPANDPRHQIDILEKVVSLAPRFAPAWADLAYLRAVQLRLGEVDSPYEVLRGRVSEACDTALRLDSRSGTAYQALAWLEPFGNYRVRESLNQRALSVAANDPLTLTFYAEFLLQVGRVAEAAGYAKRAYELDSRNAQVGVSFAADITLGMGRFAEGNEIYDRCLAIYPNSKHICALALWASTWVCMNTGDWTRYDALSARLSELDADGSVGRWTRQVADILRDSTLARRSRALDRLRQSLANDGTIQLVELVIAYAVGLRDETFDFVEQASFSHMLDPNGKPPSGIGNPGILLARAANQAMMRDVRFVGLCEKLRLCHYWVETNRWPDCADHVPYDFRKECATAMH